MRGREDRRAGRRKISILAMTRISLCADVVTRPYRRRLGEGHTHHAFQTPNQQILEQLAGLIAVAYILKGLCGILAADVHEDFFAASVVVVAALAFSTCSLCVFHSGNWGTTYGCSSTNLEAS